MTTSWKTIVGWVLTGLVAAMLFFAGLQKFIDDGTWEADFIRWGYPENLSYVIGVAEMVAALAFVYPKTSAYGGAAITGILVVAAVTRFLDGTPERGVVDLIVATIAGTLAYMRRPAWTEKWLPR